MAEEKGPSKSELKKLAKKAEKAAKKEAAKLAAGGGGGGAPTDGSSSKNDGKSAAAGGATAAPASAPTIALPTGPKILLYQGARDDPATLKVVWAAVHYKIEVGVAKKKDLPPGCSSSSSSSSSSSKKPILIFGSGDYVLGGGGNAMCKAIGLMGGEALSFETDEWCEVERTTLRNTKSKSNLKLDSLASALETSATGVHLVGESDTIADICILVTLSKYSAELASWPSKCI